MLDLKGKRTKGFVYVSLTNDQRFVNAQPSDIIVNKAASGHIVVDYSYSSIIITKWPGKLFEVEIVKEKEQVNNELVEHIWYTRTLGVKIIRELPVDLMFGKNGKQITKLIDLSSNFDEEQLNNLSMCDVEIGRELFSKAWRNWILQMDSTSSHLNDSHYNTLLFPLKNQTYSSPIKNALSIISSQFDVRLRELKGKSSIRFDEEGKKIYFNAEWSIAYQALLHAAMSYESDNLLTKNEKNIMRYPVFGRRNNERIK